MTGIRQAPTLTAADITAWLARWRAGHDEASDELMQLVYPELRRLARRAMSGERQAHTLQPTAVLNEAYLRLAERQPEWRDRGHFYAVMARTMRRVLVDHARRLNAERRGGRDRPGSLDAEPTAEPGTPLDELLALDEALNDLADADARKAKVIELRFFTGLSVGETAGLLEVSKPTVVLDTRLARDWLFAHMTRQRGRTSSPCRAS